MEGGQRTELVLTVSVQVDQHSVADGALQKQLFLPGTVGGLRRGQAPDALVCGDQACGNAVSVAARITVIAVQAILQNMQFERVLLVKFA